MRQVSILLASHYIMDADFILICAGAGMSVKDGDMVYTNPNDFAKHYPFFLKWGYKTGYEAMGLMMDDRVPDNAKWAYQATHMNNMRWKSIPNDGYHALFRLVHNNTTKPKDYFILTSNVDACFERTGFDVNKIYTPQGEWTYIQCTKPCQYDSVYDSKPYIDNMIANIDYEKGSITNNTLIPPRCPRCQTKMFGNVRAAGWFLHHIKYQTQNQKLQEWMNHIINNTKNKGKNNNDKEKGNKKKKLSVVVVEIGAGYNTPMVTRFPCEAFVRKLGTMDNNATLIRINPTEAQVPDDVNAIAIPEGWQVLQEIEQECNNKRNNKNNSTDTTTNDDDDIITAAAAAITTTTTRIVQEAQDALNKYQRKNGMTVSHHTTTKRYEQHFGHFDPIRFIQQLNH